MSLQRKYTNDQQVYEKMFKVTNHQENANQNHKGILSIHVKMATIEKQQKTTMVGKNVEKLELLHTASRNTTWCCHYGKQ